MIDTVPRMAGEDHGGAARIAGLAEAEAQLVRALEHSQLVLGLYDSNDRLQWANEAFRRVFLDELPLPVPLADLLRHGHERGLGIRIDSDDVELFLKGILYSKCVDWLNLSS